MNHDDQHRTYLLTWNPNKWNWQDLSEEIEAVAMGHRPTFRWSCGNSKRLKTGDRVFLMRLGRNCPNHGLMASGSVLHGSYEDYNWNESALRVTAQYVDFEPEVLLDPYRESLWDPTTDLPQFNWHPQSSGLEIPSPVAETIEYLWQARVGVYGNELASATGMAKSFVEGSRSTITSYRYERDPAARRVCIDYYGPVCQVCGLDFETRYGAIGKGFIHVHHLIPIAEIGEQHQVDPIRDLRPVCPNCHAMLHRLSPPHTIDELRRLLKD